MPKIIASSGGHTDVYVVNQQLVLYAYLGLYGSHDWRVRADMTYFTAPDDGAVFAWWDRLRLAKRFRRTGSTTSARY